MQAAVAKPTFILTVRKRPGEHIVLRWQPSRWAPRNVSRLLRQQWSDLTLRDVAKIHQIMKAMEFQCCCEHGISQEQWIEWLTESEPPQQRVEPKSDYWERSDEYYVSDSRWLCVAILSAVAFLAIALMGLVKWVLAL